MEKAASEKLEREKATKKILLGIAFVILGLIFMALTAMLGLIFNEHSMAKIGSVIGFIGVAVSFLIIVEGVADRLNHMSLSFSPFKFKMDKAFFTREKTLLEQLIDKKVNICVLVEEGERKFFGIVKKVEGDLIFLEMLGSGDSSSGESLPDNASSPDSASSWQIINTASPHFVRAEIVEVK